MKSTKRRALSQHIAALLVLVFVFSFAVPVAAFEADETMGRAEAAPFPTLRITVPYSPFNERNLRQAGTIEVTGAPEGQNFAPTAADVRGRGNSTWIDGPEKRPLRFHFEQPQSMFGSSPHIDWVLLSNHFDSSHMRNYAALTLARSLDNLYALNTIQFIHLYVNGSYMGVYLLTDERTAEVGRLEIEWDANPGVSGFYLELDSRAARDGRANETFVNIYHRRNHYDIRFPSGSRRTPAHSAYVREYLTAVSEAIRLGTFSDIERLIDIPSFIDFYIVQELFSNADVYMLSVFMHITGTGEDRRLFMGPAWDFDMSAGNVTHHHHRYPQPNNPEAMYVGARHYWYRNLLQHPEFFYAVVARWAEVQPEISEMLRRIQDTAVYHADCFAREMERHPVSANPLLRPGLQGYDTFEEQVQYLYNWLTIRVAWFDEFFLSEKHSGVRVIVNGAEQTLYAPPLVMDGVTKLCIYDMARVFNLNVSVNENIAMLWNDSTVITNRIGRDVFHVNHVPLNASAPSRAAQCGVFLPLRFVANILGYTVSRDGEDNAVLLDRG